MSLSISLGRNLLTRSWSVTALGAFECPGAALTVFTDSLVSSLPRDFFTPSSILRDMKGREPFAAVDESAPAGGAAPGFELFAASGFVSNNRERKLDENSFGLRVTTDFERYSGAHHIEHSVRVSRYGVLPSWVAPWQVARLIPAVLTSVRFGFDGYRSSHFAMLGFTPEATQTLLIEGGGSKLRFRLFSEKLSDPAETPLSGQSGVFEALARACESAFEFNLRKEYPDAIAAERSRNR